MQCQLYCEWFGGNTGFLLEMTYGGRCRGKNKIVGSDLVMFLPALIMSEKMFCSIQCEVHRGWEILNFKHAYVS